MTPSLSFAQDLILSKQHHPDLSLTDRPEWKQKSLEVFQSYSRFRKEWIVSDQVMVKSCEYEVQPGDYLIDILKTFSYRNPLNIGLLKLTKKMNPHVDNLDLLVVGTRLEIPLLTVKPEVWIAHKDHRCQELQRFHQSEPFIIRGHEATLSENQFFPGFSDQEFGKDRQVAQLKDSAVPATQPQDPPPRREAEKSKGPSTFGELQVGLIGGYSVLVGEGAGGSTFVSELQPGFDLRWNQIWSQNWRSYLEFDYFLASYSQPSDATFSLENSNLARTSLHLGLQYHFAEFQFFEFSLGYGETIYFTQAREDVYELRKDQTPMVSAHYISELLSRGVFSLNYKLGLMAIGSGSGNLQAGLGYSFGLNLSQRFESSYLRAGFSYQNQRFQTNSFQFDARELLFFSDYSWELGVE